MRTMPRSAHTSTPRRCATFPATRWASGRTARSWRTPAPSHRRRRWPCMAACASSSEGVCQASVIGPPCQGRAAPQAAEGPSRSPAIRRPEGGSPALRMKGLQASAADITLRGGWPASLRCRGGRMNGRMLFLALLSVLLATGTADAQQVKLKANLQAPITNPYYGLSLVRFKEQVERQSQGAIAIDIHDNGELFREDEVVAALASGAIDIGITAAHNFARKVPAVALLDQPFLFNFSELARAAASPESEVRRLIDATILTGIGVRVLWWQSLGDNVFFSKGGRDVADPGRVKDQAVGTT